VYPEVPAGLAVVAAVGALTGPLDRRARWVAVGALIALPWFSVKYLPIAAVLGAIGAVRLLRDGDRRSLLPSGGVIAAAAVGYIVFHHRVYGGWTAYASGDHFVDGELLVVGADPDYAGRTQRLLGLLVDREFGLAAWNPAWLMLPLALAIVLRCRLPRRAAVGLLLPLATGWATATWIALTMHGWEWPGRQVVAILPLGVLAIAIAVDHRRRWLPPLLAAGLVGAAGWVWIVVEATTGRRTLIVDFADTANPWYRLWSRALPDFQNPIAATAVLAALWTLGLGWACVAAWRSARGDEYPAGGEGTNADVTALDLDRGRPVG
jgi:hypothetical protein